MRLWLLKWILNSPSLEERAVVLSTALQYIDTFPANDIIRIEADQTIRLNGQPIDYDLATTLRESAKQVRDSFARKVVREQVAFKAIAIGVHNANTPEQVLFAKSALWWGQQEDEMYRLLANE